MKKIILYIVIFSFVCLNQHELLAQKKGKSSKGVTQDDTQAILDKRIKTEALFLEGLQARLLGNDLDAIDKMKQVLKIDAKNAAACYELTRIYFEMGDMDNAEKYGTTSIKLDPNNEWYYIYLAETKAQKGDFQGASKVYENLTKAKPKDFEYYNDWAFMLSKQNKFKEAIAVYDLLEKKMGGSDEELIFEKVNLLLNIGDFDRSIGEMQKLIKLDPREYSYYGMLAEIFEAKKDFPNAISAYEDLLKIDPENTDATVALAKIYQEKGDQVKYNEIISRLFRNKTLDIDSKILAFIPFIEEMIDDTTKGKETLRLADIILEAHPDDPKAITAKADVLLNLNQKEAAKAAYISATEKGDCPLTIWTQLLTVLSEMNDNAGIMVYGEKAMEKFPQEPILNFYYSIGAIQLKETKAAISSLEKGVALQNRNPQLLVQMYTTLGDLYSGIKEYEKADTIYEKALTIDPNNPTVLNNYAYFLSVRNIKIEKAERMSRKSNLLEDKNSAFQDTYAWILYQKGNYKEAKIWMEKAMGKNETLANGVLWEHYGDILFKLGDVDKAMIYWKKALEANPEDEDKLKEKIKTKSIP